MTNTPIQTRYPIFLARHAAPRSLSGGLVYHLPPGPALSEHGIREANALADFLSVQNAKAVLCSPLERCMQTGRIVQERLAIPVTVREALKEIQPQEKTEDILERAWPVFLEALQVQDEVDGPVVILTHGGVVHVLLLGLGMASDTAERYCVFEHHNLIATAGAWEVNSENGNGGWAAQMRFSPKISIGEGQPRASL